MNSMNINISKFVSFGLTFLAFFLCSRSLGETSGELYGEWETLHHDPSVFFGSLVISETEILYTFVYNEQRINDNLNQEDTLIPIGEDCYLLNTAGQFLYDLSEMNEVLICYRDGNVVWSALVNNSDNSVFPNWIRFKKLNPK